MRESELPKRPESNRAAGPFDAVVFAGGGCRCFWQAGFWSVAEPALGIEPRQVAGTSAGAAFACAAVGGVIDGVLDDFKQRLARNRRNLYPANLFGGTPVFPHERIYRGSLLANLTQDVLARIHRGPDLRIFIARPPERLGVSSAVMIGLLSYQLERATRGRVHPFWSRRLGFRGEVVSATSCASAEELADLVLQSSCTPPITPLYRRSGRIVLDGGLVDGVPVEAVEPGSRTLVLLTRSYPASAIPAVPGRCYVGPSRPTPVAKWDYTNPTLVQQTFDLGRRDAEAFVAASRNTSETSTREAS